MAYDRICQVKWKAQDEALVPTDAVGETGFRNRSADVTPAMVAQIEYDSTLKTDAEALDKLLEILDTEAPTQAPQPGTSFTVEYRYEYF